jgi:hypothetical protein
VIPIPFTGPAQALFTKIFKVVICITHLTLRRHFTFHQQRFNSSYPSRQFAIPLKVTIALEIFTYNKPYFIHCRKKKLLAFSDLDFIHLFTCLWRNFPFLVISKVVVTFDVCFDKLTRQILKIILLFIELYVAWQLREGTQFSHKGKIRSSSIGQFD